MACAKTSMKAEQPALQDKLRAMGLIAADQPARRGTSDLKAPKTRASAIRGAALLVAATVLLGAGCSTRQTTNGTVHGTVSGSGWPAAIPPKRLGPSPMKQVTVTVTSADSFHYCHIE